jgi:hypothetical protein
MVLLGSAPVGASTDGGVRPDLGRCGATFLSEQPGGGGRRHGAAVPRGDRRPAAVLLARAADAVAVDRAQRFERESDRADVRPPGVVGVRGVRERAVAGVEGHPDAREADPGVRPQHAVAAQLGVGHVDLGDDDARAEQFRLVQQLVEG